MIHIDPEPDGADAFVDMSRILECYGTSTPRIFDVGANIGQSITKFRRSFPTSEIHAFEPVPKSCAILRKEIEGLDGVTLNHAAVGNHTGHADVTENSSSDMSSVLPLGPAGWGDEVQKHEVELISLDDYCKSRSIEKIDILKIDTQGYELEVLTGSSRLTSEKSIALVYLELIFSEMYVGMAKPHEVLAFMSQHCYTLIGLHNMHYRDGRAGWIDAMFTPTAYI